MVNVFSGDALVENTVVVKSFVSEASCSATIYVESTILGHTYYTFIICVVQMADLTTIHFGLVAIEGGIVSNTDYFLFVLKLPCKPWLRF